MKLSQTLDNLLRKAKLYVSFMYFILKQYFVRLTSSSDAVVPCFQDASKAAVIRLWQDLDHITA